MMIASASRSAPPATALSAGSKTAAAMPGDARADAIAADLGSDNNARIDQAIKLLDGLSAANERDVRRYLRPKWLKPLIALKRYDEIETLASTELQNLANDAACCSAMQCCRVEALLAAGKYEEALVAAKAYYNVATLAETERAINLFAQALAHTRGKDDPEIVRRFKQQQIDDAEAPTTAPADESTQTSSDNILSTIALDPAPYEQRLAAYQHTRQNYNALWAQGNLLLVSGKPSQARECFEKAFDVTPPNKWPAAIENIARAIRAEDSSVGRANAYILALRQGDK
jgi:tetratricopeptide (TPR) repeat protein